MLGMQAIKCQGLRCPKPSRRSAND